MQLLVMVAEDDSDALWGWSITTMDGFCRSPPRQPQLRALLGRGTLITIIIIITHSITFPCLRLFCCNFNETFKSRSRFSLRRVLRASSLPFSPPFPLHAMQGNTVPVFLGREAGRWSPLLQKCGLGDLQSPPCRGTAFAPGLSKGIICAAKPSPVLCVHLFGEHRANNKPFPGALLAGCVGNEISGYLNTEGREKNLIYFIFSRTFLFAFQSLVAMP